MAVVAFAVLLLAAEGFATGVVEEEGVKTAAAGLKAKLLALGFSGDANFIFCTDSGALVEPEAPVSFCGDSAACFELCDAAVSFMSLESAVFCTLDSMVVVKVSGVSGESIFEQENGLNKRLTRALSRHICSYKSLRSNKE